MRRKQIKWEDMYVEIGSAFFTPCLVHRSEENLKTDQRKTIEQLIVIERQGTSKPIAAGQLKWTVTDGKAYRRSELMFRCALFSFLRANNISEPLFTITGQSLRSEDIQFEWEFIHMWQSIKVQFV